MKKIRLIGLLVLVVACLTLVLSLETKNVNADEVVEKRVQVQNLLNSYIDKNEQYTKLTTLHNDNINGSYHGGASTSQRRTWYDENVNALFMGNYDGTVGGIEGKTGINSGYAQTDAKNFNMQHYRNNAEELSKDILFTAKNVDYTVYNTNPKEYFDVLSALAKKSSESTEEMWTNNNGVYTYRNTEITCLSVGNPYNDVLLKMYQYFAAPMVLVSETVDFAKVMIYEANGRIEDNDGKVLVIKLLSASDLLLSTCYVVPGLVMGEVEVETVQLNAENFDLPGEERFAAYFFNKGEDYKQWLSLEATDAENIYEVELPRSYTDQVVFCRMNGAMAENDMDNRWNQTFDVDMSKANGAYYVMNYSKNDGGVDKYFGDWNLEVSTEWTIRGTHNGWKASDKNLYHYIGTTKYIGYVYFDPSKGNGEFKIAVYNENSDEWTTRYPANNWVAGTGNYLITFDNSGEHPITATWGWN